MSTPLLGIRFARAAPLGRPLVPGSLRGERIIPDLLVDGHPALGLLHDRRPKPGLLRGILLLHGAQPCALGATLALQAIIYLFGSLDKKVHATSSSERHAWKGRPSMARSLARVKRAQRRNR